MSADVLYERKKKSLEDLEMLLTSLKRHVDLFLRDIQGTDLSARLKKIAEALDVYRNACDNYAAYFMK
jgi:hypothetical protein